MLGNYSQLSQSGNYKNNYYPVKYDLDIVDVPDDEPVSLEEVKDHLRITDTNDDKVIASLIVVARQNLELYTGRAFVEQTWKMFMDCFPFEKSSPWWQGERQGPIDSVISANAIIMPLAPLQSITHIKTYSNADVATTFSSSSYQVVTQNGLYAKPGRIVLREGSTWPTFTRNAHGIEIQFVAGYGEPDDVPEAIKQAIKEEVSFRYENRGECGDLVGSSIAKSMIKMFKLEKL